MSGYKPKDIITSPTSKNARYQIELISKDRANHSKLHLINLEMVQERKPKRQPKERQSTKYMGWFNPYENGQATWDKTEIYALGKNNREKRIQTQLRGTWKNQLRTWEREDVPPLPNLEGEPNLIEEKNDLQEAIPLSLAEAKCTTIIQEKSSTVIVTTTRAKTQALGRITNQHLYLRYQGRTVEVPISNTSNNDLRALGPEHVNVESDSSNTFGEFTYEEEMLDKIEEYHTEESATEEIGLYDNPGRI
ncbi:18308_t:CDS:2 [Gigaspora margarita]|uniref:18308_t:CDS:1 n=1 Tax=Gigaspora margarita TaxID=4874 RepID=A0ABN7USZ7_GIGMA|nr:18308_t:CDS:2 [Gigaspora margarita]